MSSMETDLNITKIEEKLKKLQDEHLTLIKSQTFLADNELSQYNNSTGSRTSSSTSLDNSPDSKIENDNWKFDDEYYDLNGQIDYKNIFKFNKNHNFDSFDLTKESRSNNLLNYGSIDKINERKYDYLNDSNCVSFNMNNDVYKKYQESKKISNEIISTLNQAKTYQVNSLILNKDSNLDLDLEKLNINRDGGLKLEVKYKPTESAFDSDPDVIKLRNNAKDSDDKIKPFLDFNKETCGSSVSSLSISTLSGSKDKEYFKSTYLNDQTKVADLKEDETKLMVKDKDEKILYENPYKSYKQELEEIEKNKYDKVLDSEFLKIMDKKLKKLIKTNFQIDQINSNSTPMHKSAADNKISNQSMYKNGDCLNNFSFDDSICSSFITNQHLSHPYLPLREVPMHDLVKKLQKEFEMEGDESNSLPDELWQKLKSDINLKNQNELSKQDLSHLKNYFKNPIKEVINKISDQEITDFVNLMECSKNKFKKNIPDLSIVVPSKNSNIKDKQNHQECKVFNKLKDMNLEQDENIKHNIKEMIRKQKEKHEKKLRILENLTYLENLQLNRLMSTYTSEDLINNNNNESNCKLNNDEEILMNLINNSNQEMTNYKMKLIANDVNFCKTDDKNLSEQYLSRVPTSWSKQPHLVNLNEENEISIIDESNYENNNNNQLDITSLIEQVETENRSQQLSLQDAFKIHKQELIERSNQRLRQIKIKSQSEKLKTELRNLKLIEIEESTVNKRKLIEEKSRKTYDFMEINLMPQDKKANFIRRRHMSTKEIKNQTKKMYKKLPEVKQKELDKKMQETKKHNRIKSVIFKKMIQQRVLMNGPNFNLSFRALESSIQ